MEPAYRIEKKLKNKEYTEVDLLNYLSHNNISAVYPTLSVIAKNRINNPEILNKVRQIASGTDKISDKGYPAMTMQFVAIATLKELNDLDMYEKYYNELSEPDQRSVLGALS